MIVLIDVTRLTKMLFMNCDNTPPHITHMHKHDQLTPLRKRPCYSETYRNNCENQDTGENYLLLISSVIIKKTVKT